MVKKKNNSKIYFGLFIAFLMISSTVGFMYGGGAETKKINGYKFNKTDSIQYVLQPESSISGITKILNNYSDT